MESAQTREPATLSRRLGLVYGRGDKAIDGLHVVGGGGHGLDHVAVASRRRPCGEKVGNRSLSMGVGIVKLIGGLHRPRRDLLGVHVAMAIDDSVLLYHNILFRYKDTRYEIQDTVIFHRFSILYLVSL